MVKRRKASRRARASTGDVVGFKSDSQIRPKWREHFGALMKLRNRLLERKGVLMRDASTELPALSLHIADAATDTYDRDFALSIATNEQNALYEIDQALNRIRDGSYGVCEVTGKPIEKERLKAIPWTRFSAATEKELERAGVLKRARLGQLAGLAQGGEREREEEGEEE